MNIEDARKYFDKMLPNHIEGGHKGVMKFEDEPELVYRYLREKYVELLTQYKTWQAAYLNIRNAVKIATMTDENWMSGRGLVQDGDLVGYKDLILNE